MKSQTRFFNFLIDTLVFLGIVFVFSILLKDIVEREVLKPYLIVVYYLYYFLFELLMGQTIGKMLTRTKVVTSDNKGRPAVFQLVLRTLSRLIPIDFISYLFGGNGIHDYLSRTRLVEK